MLRIVARGLCGIVAGIALWCTLGVAALDASSSPARVIGLFPPLWLLAVCVVGLTAIVVLVRQFSALPFLLTGILIVPWTGLPVGPLLLWHGPLSVLVWFIVAVAAAKGSFHRRWLAESPTAVAFAVCVVIGFIHLGGDLRRTTGDEPHYLIIASSLIEDGDVDLTNDYDERRHQAFYPGSLEPRHTVLTPAGRQYSLHGHGVAFLVLPGFWAGGIVGARMIILALTTLGTTLLWIALRRASGSVAAAWAAIAGLGMQIPFAAQASAIYPDGPAAAVTSIGLWLLLEIQQRRIPRRGTMVLAGLALATLPWLHIRLAAIAFVLAVALTIAVWRRNDRWPALAALFAVPMASAVVWIASFAVMFETLDPTAPFREKAGGSLAGMPIGILGLLTDQEYGLLPYAPALAFAVLGLASGCRKFGLTAWCGLALFFSTLAIGASYVWWGGTSAPARFLVPVLPAMAFYVGMWWTSASRTLRSTYVVCVALGALLLLFGSWADGGARLAGDPDGRFTVFEWINTLVDVPATLPALFRPGTSLSREVAIASTWVISSAVLLAIISQIPARNRSRAVLLAGCGLIAWISAGAQAAPLTADRSQVSLLQAAFARPWLTTGLSRDQRLVSRDVIVANLAFMAPGTGPTLLHVPNAPPGRYRVEISGAAPDEALVLEAGRDAWPIWLWKAGSTSEAPTFTLVAPVHSLRVISTSPQPRALEARLHTLPLGPALAHSKEAATRVTRYSRWFVYSLDRSSYMETGGFWTAGDRTTRIVVADIDGMSPSYALQLEAGPRAVTVRLESAGGVQDIALDADQRTRILMPSTSTIAPLAITVQGGFDAASAFANRSDRRWLGVWVSISAVNGS